MTRQNATGLISIHDPLLIVLELMRTFVTSVLGEHTDQAGLCVVCSTCPCERVVVAVHNLAVIWRGPKDRQEWRRWLWTLVASSAIHSKQRQ